MGNLKPTFLSAIFSWNLNDKKEQPTGRPGGKTFCQQGGKAHRFWELKGGNTTSMGAQGREEAGKTGEGSGWLPVQQEVTEGAEAGDWPDPTDLLKIFLAPRRDWMRMGQEEEERDQLKG